MFDSLTDRLASTFSRLRGKGKLTQEDVTTALREIRLALLEADVHYKVVKDLIARIRERAVGEEVLESLTPGQQVVKIVRDELAATMGKEQAGLSLYPSSGNNHARRPPGAPGRQPLRQNSASSSKKRDESPF